MGDGILVQIGPDALNGLINYAEQMHWVHCTLVADERTYAALGAAVQSCLVGSGRVITPVILAGSEVVADESTLIQVLLHADPESDVYLAVGAGTITDIVRFASHCNRRPFVSVPTAPSVDGFASAGAPLIVGGFKQTVQCRPPLAVFADLPTLCAAPRSMIAAGLGDMVGKYTSLADWQLGRLLWDEPYDEPAAQRTERALQGCILRIDGIARAERDGIAALMDGLLESGLCIAEIGHSRPASGAEHHISHYWEMKLLREGRPAVLHGAKVGVASLAVAGVYEAIRHIDGDEAEVRLARATLPDRERQMSVLVRGFGLIAPQIAAAHEAFLQMSPGQFAMLRDRVRCSWPRIQEIAEQVPEPAELAALLNLVGGPTCVQPLGLTDEEACEGLFYGHYLRNRFTVLKLASLLGLLDDVSAAVAFWPPLQSLHRGVEPVIDRIHLEIPTVPGASR